MTMMRRTFLGTMAAAAGVALVPTVVLAAARVAKPLQIKTGVYPAEIDLSSPLRECVPCDGRLLSRAAYKDLFDAIGEAYAQPGDTDDTLFRVPAITQSIPEDTRERHGGFVAMDHKGRTLEVETLIQAMAKRPGEQVGFVFCRIDNSQGV